MSSQIHNNMMITLELKQGNKDLMSISEHFVGNNNTLKYHPKVKASI